jgi:membrane protease YdiL (CAAX protease family)
MLPGWLAAPPTPGNPLDRLRLPLTPLREVSIPEALLSHPIVKALLPLPLLPLIGAALYWFFRPWWREFDHDATRERAAALERGEVDYRPAVCLMVTAVVLTLQEYYGGRPFYDHQVRPLLYELQVSHGWAWLKLAKYDEYYGYVWWSFARCAGYVLIPFPLWKLLFPKDSLLDLGLRVHGFFRHAWVYGVCFLLVLPGMLLAAVQPDFVNYYPFYRQSSRSLCDWALWELVYFAQFLTLEIFFRGWMLGAMRRSLGSAAVFVMAVPYCMIHYGKPYHEALGAVIAGVVLGTLAMRTRSVYGGFLVHVAVALLMDIIALWRRDALPTTLWAPG